MNFPENLKYSKDHKWVKVEKDYIIIGITDFAQNELGDIVYIDVDNLGDTVMADTVFGSVEAVKTASDLFMPITGEIIAFNKTLEDNPETINTDPYKKGWIIKVIPKCVSDINNLLNAEIYQKIIGM